VTYTATPDTPSPTPAPSVTDTPAVGSPKDAGPSVTTAGDGPQPQDIDAAEWTERETADVAGCEIIDIPTPCPTCQGIVFWWDLAGGAYCEACSPRTVGPRLRELAQRLRERYTQRAAG
jgi:hypothetical protein